MKTSKILLIIITFAIILSLFNTIVFATTNFETNEYDPGTRSKAGGNTSQLQVIGNKIVGIIRTIGSIISVGALIVLGIKYMAGSIEEKAQYKETMIPYVIGALFTFGIINILAVIIKVAEVFG